MPDSLSNKQFASHVSENGGGSVGFFDRKPVTGHGFMTAAVPAAERTEHSDVSHHHIREYREEHAATAATLEHPVHGVWGRTQDISVKTHDVRHAEEIAHGNGEYASYALGGTPLSARHRAPSHGTDVLLHTADLGKNDVDHRYRPGAIDHPEHGHTTRNQYQNKDWGKVGGTVGPAKTPVTHGDLVTYINKNRADRIRASVGRSREETPGGDSLEAHVKNRQS